MFGLGIPELLVILLIVVLLFGTKKLKSLGTDLGGAIKGFRKAVNSEETEAATTDNKPTEARAIEGASVEPTKDKEREQQRNV